MASYCLECSAPSFVASVAPSLPCPLALCRQFSDKKAHLRTCKWLFQQPEYRDWLDRSKISDNHGFLWIKGKPGTGESTLMKYTLEQIEKTLTYRKNRLSYHSPLMRGAKSLRNLPLACIDLFSFNYLNSATISEQWDAEVLKITFLHAVERFEQEHLLCLVDALDECPEDQIRDMIEFFESSSELAASNGMRFHVCFFSQHYPHISIRKGVALILENQESHSNDISTYLSAELRAGKGKQVQEIKSQILEKAFGIFVGLFLSCEY